MENLHRCINTFGFVIAENIFNNQQCAMSHHEVIFLLNLALFVLLKYWRQSPFKFLQSYLCKHKEWILDLNVICLWYVCIYTHTHTRVYCLPPPILVNMHIPFFSQSSSEKVFVFCLTRVTVKSFFFFLFALF